MRIGFFSGKFIDGGSLRSVVEPLARGLQAVGHQVFVLDLHPWKSGLNEVNGLPVYTISTRRNFLRKPGDGIAYSLYLLTERYHRWNRSPQPSPSQPLPFHRFLSQLQRIFIQEFNLDVLCLFHTQNFVSLITEHLPEDVFTVVNFIGFGSDRSRGGGWDSFPYQRMLFENPAWNLQVTASQFEYEQYESVYQHIGLSAEKLVFLPHPYDQEIFFPWEEPRREDLRREYGLSPQDRILFYPVQVYPRKNIELAIEVLACLMKDIPAVLLVSGLVYDQDYLRHMKELALQLGVEERVKFLGGVDPNRMPGLYNMADVTIFPSHQETFGLGIVESFACGTKVVGPAYIRPCREILQDMPGGFLAEKTVEDFTRQLKIAFVLPMDRQTVSAGAKNRYGNLTIADRWISTVSHLYERFLSQKAYLDNLDWRSLYEDDLELQ
jgi:glycosyltransferase involved in cell wall biosynthesis